MNENKHGTEASAIFPVQITLLKNSPGESCEFLQTQTSVFTPCAGYFKCTLFYLLSLYMISINHGLDNFITRPWPQQFKLSHSHTTQIFCVHNEIFILFHFINLFFLNLCLEHILMFLNVYGQLKTDDMSIPAVVDYS